MRKLTTLVADELSDLNDITFIEINYIHKIKLSITMKYHYFEVVTSKNLDSEGHKYKEVDYFN